MCCLARGIKQNHLSAFPKPSPGPPQTYQVSERLRLWDKMDAQFKNASWENPDTYWSLLFASQSARPEQRVQVLISYVILTQSIPNLLQILPLTASVFSRSQKTKWDNKKTFSFPNDKHYFLLKYWYWFWTAFWCCAFST